MKKYRMKTRPVVDATQFTGSVEQFNHAARSKNLSLRPWGDGLFMIWHFGEPAIKMKVTEWAVWNTGRSFVVMSDADFRDQFEEVGE